MRLDSPKAQWPLGLKGEANTNSRIALTAQLRLVTSITADAGLW